MEYGSFLHVDELCRMINDPLREGDLFAEMEALRARVAPQFLLPFHDANRSDAIDRAIEIIGSILGVLFSHGSIQDIEASHGLGHLCRDFAHALLLVQDEIVPVNAVVPVLAGGVLHDVGTLFVDRYAEPVRAVRHAEVSALLVRAAALESGALSMEEADLVAYLIAAHTHYLNPQNVTCEDAVIRTVHPYLDLIDRKPFFPVWFVRWIDRLDICGPCSPARFYLTLTRDHFDYGHEGFYQKSFIETMNPFLRNGEDIQAAGGSWTMVEYLYQYAISQTADSPYGRYDAGIMMTLRDRNKELVGRIIESVLHPTDVDVERVLGAWTIFLGTNVEPTEQGRAAADALAIRFRQLDPDVQRAWASGFRTTMVEYRAWADRLLAFLDGQPARRLRIPGLFEDVREVIRPNPLWTEVVL